MNAARKFWSWDRTLGKTSFSGFYWQLHFTLIQKELTHLKICPLQAYVGLQ